MGTLGVDPVGSTSIRPIDVTAATPADQLRLSEASQAWSATKDTANLGVLDAFVARYRDTFFAELARARIEELRTPTAPPLPSP